MTAAITARINVGRSYWTARLGAVVLVAAIETLLISGLIQRVPIDLLAGAPRALRDTQHWLFRFLIVYFFVLAMLVYLRRPDSLRAPVLATPRAAIAGPLWGVLHVMLLVPFAVLSAGLYAGTLAQSFAATAVEWHACAIAVALSLFAAVAPLATWHAALRRTGLLTLVALLPAAAAVLAIRLSQDLWEPTAALTFRLVQLLLQPFLPQLHGDATTLTLITERFAVTVSEKCSGLEGIGLMLVFCATWLGVFRREYIFPRTLIILPFAVVFVFILNAVRIAAIVLIGDAGYTQIASVGFHSQAGWIAFNLAAFGVVVIARHSSSLHRHAQPQPQSQPPSIAHNPTAAYLLPLLAILGVGVITNAVSGGFDFLYPLRFIAAALVLLAYRKRYAAIDWRFSWRGPAAGVLIFGLWIAYAEFTKTPEPKPEALATLSAPLYGGWLACRVLAAILTVPIAEELAYRGYLLRRLVQADFERVDFKNVRWPALLLSSIAFGITHGGMWLPGSIAGFAYGLLAIRTGKLGEAAAAHATTNALIAVAVLGCNQWQLW